MKIEPKDSLTATFWGLLVIWLLGGIGIMLATGQFVFSIMYAIILAPVFLLIYCTAKAEITKQLNSGSKETSGHDA